MSEDSEIDFPSNWTVDREAQRAYIEVETKDFMEAIDIVNELARIAEEQMHHPDIHLEEWNHLRVATWSHDVGKLTERDEELAKAVNELLAKRGYGP